MYKTRNKISLISVAILLFTTHINALPPQRKFTKSMVGNHRQPTSTIFNSHEPALLQPRDRNERQKQATMTANGTRHSQRTAELRSNFASDRWTPDTVYYQSIKRIGSWIVGDGKQLTKREALKADHTFRFTMKAGDSRYLHVESLTHGLNPTPSHYFSSYLIPSEGRDYDLVFCNDTRWLEQQDSISHVYIIPTSDGKQVQAEMAYTSDNSVVHTATVEPIDNQRQVICYHNSDGELINLTSPACYNYGTLALAVTDSLGNNTITIIDSTGYPIKHLR